MTAVRLAKEAGLIAKSEIFPRLLIVCPSFVTTWEILQHGRNGTSDDALHDRAVDALCRHIARMLRRARTETLAVTFAVIERLFVEGEPDVQKKVRSLIQTLQNQVRATANLHQIRPLLGTRSAEQWDDFEKWLQANQMIFQWQKSRNGAFPQLDLESIMDPELRRSLQHTCERYKPK
jgi:hypothetical protein